MRTNFFFTPLFSCCFWIRDPGWVKIRIRDPGLTSRIRNADSNSGISTVLAELVKLESGLEQLASAHKLANNHHFEESALSL
jgi:hypothetical protein